MLLLVLYQLILLHSSPVILLWWVTFWPNRFFLFPRISFWVVYYLLYSTIGTLDWKHVSVSITFHCSRQTHIWLHTITFIFSNHYWCLRVGVNVVSSIGASYIICVWMAFVVYYCREKSLNQRRYLEGLVQPKTWVLLQLFWHLMMHHI